MNSEAFKNHSLFENLDNLINRLKEKESKEKIDDNRYSFFISIHQYISDRIKITIPVLVQESEINSLSSDLENGLAKINAFLGNGNVGHLNNATNTLNSALNRIRNFPLPFAKNDFNFSKSIADFNSLIQEKYEILKNENDEMTKSLDTFQSDLETKNNEIERLFKLLESKKNEIQNLNSKFQTNYNGIKTSATQNYEQDRKTFRNEFDDSKKIYREEIDSLKQSIDTGTEKIIQDLNKKLDEAKQIVGAVSDNAVTGNYKIVANSHKTTADVFRVIAILLMITMSTLLIIAIWDVSSASYDWTKSLVRILAAAALSYPATYAARESSKHRKLEITNRKSELELTAIGPFIELFPEIKKQDIKEKLVEKFFGNNSNIYDETKDEKEVEISIGTIERLVKTLLPFIKKQ